MPPYQQVTADGCGIVIRLRNGRVERHEFTTQDEARGRAEFIREALTWVGTPFRDCADVKGQNGAVDCAMLLVRSAVDTGLIAPFDPRPYPPRWHLHRSEERFLGVLQQLGTHEVPEPKVGDVLVWQFGRCFSHGGILVNHEEVVHAYGASGMVLVTRRDETLLTTVSLGRKNFPRPVKSFSLWS